MLLTALTARRMIHDAIFNRGIYLSFSEWAITAVSSSKAWERVAEGSKRLFSQLTVEPWARLFER